MDKILDHKFKDRYIKVYNSELDVHDVFSQLQEKSDQYSINSIYVKEDADVGMAVCEGECSVVEFPTIYSNYYSCIDSVNFKLNSGDSIEIDNEHITLMSLDGSLEIDSILKDKEKQI